MRYENHTRNRKIVDYIRANQKRMSRSEIARATGASTTLVHTLCKKHNLNPVKIYWTESYRDKVKVIIKYLKRGKTRLEICEITGFAYSTVSRICREHGVKSQFDVFRETILKYLRNNPDKTIAEAAGFLDLSEGHVRRLCRDNDIWLAGMSKTLRWKAKFE
jgi:DNA-binding MurR/RpiR family transcriptional regulator